MTRSRSREFGPLPETVASLEAYDASPDAEKARAVGVAYGLETADRNDPQTCADLVRPGKKVPAHPDDLSFVRRMVRKYGR